MTKDIEDFDEEFAQQEIGNQRQIQAALQALEDAYALVYEQWEGLSTRIAALQARYGLNPIPG
jgi:hypothetical protein